MSRVLSMTGFSSVEGEIGPRRYRVEIKTLNHRFLDIKTKLARELSAADLQVRAAIQSALTRGTVEVKVERLTGADASPGAIQLDLALAARYHEALVRIQQSVGLSDPLRTSDIALFPDVIRQSATELQADEAWTGLQPLLSKGVDQLIAMRASEGVNLTRFFLDALVEFDKIVEHLRARRTECQTAYGGKIRERVKAAFDAYPLPSAVCTDSALPAVLQSVLEARIAQELALIFDRTDIEEELVRMKGHVQHFERTLREGGPVGRKLDFILQEMNRETNTLGNKAQDFQISEEVVKLKVRLEQLREQVMNLE